MFRYNRRKVVSSACAAMLVAAMSTAARADASSDEGSAAPWWLGDVPGLGATAPDRPAPDGAMKLSGCTITNPMFEEDPARLRQFVPQHYEFGTNPYIGPSAATVIVAVLACDATDIDGRDHGPMVLNLFAVQVVSEAGDTGDVADAAWRTYDRSALNFLPSSSWYLVEGHTDNSAVASALAANGLPVSFVKDLGYQTDYSGTLKSDVVAVDRRPEGAYALSTRTRLADPFVHNHDWTFWHEGSEGRVGFLLHLHAMSDTSCGYNFHTAAQAVEPSCGTTITADPQSRVGNLLGIDGDSHRDTPFAFNHPVSNSPGFIAPLLQGHASNRPESDASHQHRSTP